MKNMWLVALILSVAAPLWCQDEVSRWDQWDEGTSYADFGIMFRQTDWEVDTVEFSGVVLPFPSDVFFEQESSMLTAAVGRTALSGLSYGGMLGFGTSDGDLIVGGNSTNPTEGEGGDLFGFISYTFSDMSSAKASNRSFLFGGEIGIGLLSSVWTYEENNIDDEVTNVAFEPYAGGVLAHSAGDLLIQGAAGAYLDVVVTREIVEDDPALNGEFTAELDPDSLLGLYFDLRFTFSGATIGLDLRLISETRFALTAGFTF